MDLPSGRKSLLSGERKDSVRKGSEDGVVYEEGMKREESGSVL